MSKNRRKLGYQEQDVAQEDRISHGAEDRMYDSHIDYEAQEMAAKSSRHSVQYEGVSEETHAFLPKHIKASEVEDGADVAQKVENEDIYKRGRTYAYLCYTSKFDNNHMVLATILAIITIFILYISYDSMYMTMTREFHAISIGRSLGKWKSLSPRMSVPIWVA